MSSTSGTDNDDIFISVISDIKTYKGTDPILPWLRGIRKMKASLSPNILKEKLPRFLQKCAQAFESDRRYSNDLRYLRVWLQLAKIFHFGSATLIEEPCKSNHITAMGIAKDSGCILSYGPNLRLPLWPSEDAARRAIMGIWDHADVFLISDDEASYLSSFPNPFYDDPRDDVLSLSEDTLIFKRLFHPKLKLLLVTQEDRASICEGEKTCSYYTMMDFVDDPKALLCTMEEKHIGIKRSLFYQAYALYYEKLKKFEKADMMYHQGVQNLADPLDDLKKSYEQFLQRMEHKKKKIQKMAGKSILRVKNVPTKFDDTRIKNDKTCETHYKLSGAKDQVPKETVQHAMPGKESKSNSSLNKIARGDSGHLNQKSNDKCNKFRSDDTVYRFVDTAIVRSEEDNACHHGLVEPTINTKEALNAINSMFREPLDPTLVNKRSNRNQPKPIVNPKVDQGFEVFIDENVNDNRFSDQKGEKGFEQRQQEPFQIYVDGEDDDVEKRGSEDNLERSSAFVFLNPNDISENSADDNIEMSSRARLGEDTVVVRRFVGKAISDEPKVENVCHHGLVEPTINWKEAMNDINSMFGKPIDFVRTTRRKRLENNLKSNNQSNGFVILPDVELDHRKEGNLKPRSTAKIGSDLFEPTVCTKEALDDINKFFAMPLDS